MASDDPEMKLSDASANMILTNNLVEITKAVNLNPLKPYLVKNNCVTLVELRELFQSLSNMENVLQMVEIISKRGAAAFNGFLKSLDQYTSDEPGEKAMKELLQKLRDDVQKKLTEPKISSSKLPPAPTVTAPTNTEQETQSTEDAPRTADPETAASRPADAETAAPRPAEAETTENQEGPGDIPGVPFIIINFLRCTSVALFLLSLPLTIAGVLILVMSIREFAEELSCTGVGITHSLSVFNFFFALLCFGAPALLILFFIYFGCADPRKTKWRERNRVTRCVVWAQVTVFLIVFILIVFELLYSLLYIIPELINHYREWQDSRRTNETICDNEIYITSFSIVTVSYSTVFILLVVLGVLLANYYFKWISDEDDPGLIMKIVYTILGRTLTGPPAVAIA